MDRPARLAWVVLFLAVGAALLVVHKSGIVTMTSEEVHFQSGDIILEGTLELPRWGKPPYPAAVIVHGSGQKPRQTLRGYAEALVPEGYAVLLYDKRGVGGSEGELPDFTLESCGDLFSLLASDALAAVEFLRQRDEIDPRRIGLVGGSQAGWIQPLAADRADTVAFVVNISGPVVTCAEEHLFSQITRDDTETFARMNYSYSEFERQMASYEGPQGYDPVPVLERLEVPSLWVLGGRDASVPTAWTVRNLERLRAQGRPVTLRLYPEGDHGLRRSGQLFGRIRYWPEIIQWLEGQGVAPP